MKKATADFLAKFSSKIVLEPGPLDTMCMVWTGSRVNGYGQIWNPEKASPYGAHRYVCELEHGQLPHGHTASHLCHNKACVNPAHVIPETLRQNTDRRRLGLKGVGYRKKGDKFEVRSYKDGKQVYLGLYEDEAEAQRVSRQHQIEENNRKNKVGYVS